MKIGFIGAGRVGFSLGRYFSERHMDVSGYYSRNPRSAREAAAFTGSEFFDTMSGLADASDVIFITTPDDVILDVWNRLKTLAVRNKMICHCSGALSSAVFSEIDRTGASGCSIHPLCAVSSRLTSYRDLSNAFFTIEGPEAYSEYWKKLFTSWGNPVQIIDAGQKIKYHCAAVFAGNYIAPLLSTALGLLVECGFEKETAVRALLKMSENHLDNIRDLGLSGALTGPVERGDVETVRGHLSILTGNDRTLYTLLALKLLDIAKEKNPEKDYGRLEAVLKEENREE